MRELKFRAWDIKNMISMPLNTNYGLSRFFGILSGGAKVMQYTGLKDKNGKEIFEGDILTPHMYAGMQKDKTFISEVIFKKGMFALKPNGKFIEKLSPLYRTLNRGKKAGNGYVIIGNITENPELLED